MVCVYLKRNTREGVLLTVLFYDCIYPYMYINIYICVGTLVVGTDADVRSAFCRPAAKSFRFNTPFKIRGCRFPGKYVALDGTRNIIYADKCDEI